MAEQRPERPNRKTPRPGSPNSGNNGMRFGKGLFGWGLFIGLAIMLIILVKNHQTAMAEHHKVNLAEAGE